MGVWNVTEETEGLMTGSLDAGNPVTPRNNLLMVILCGDGTGLGGGPYEYPGVEGWTVV